MHLDPRPGARPFGANTIEQLREEGPMVDSGGDDGALEVIAPRVVGSVRNLAQLAPFVVWRGEHPLADLETVEALGGLGIDTILSLRKDWEEERAVTGRLNPFYSGPAERTFWERHGFGYRQVQMEDYAAPQPEEVRDSMLAIDEEVAADHKVYLHCRAGVGRTGVVSAAWLISRGWTANDAVAMYVRFCDEIYQRASEYAATNGDAVQPREEYGRRVGFPSQIWALQQISEALGSPITRELGIKPERPEGTEGWEARYRSSLAPWRTR